MWWLAVSLFASGLLLSCLSARAYCTCSISEMVQLANQPPYAQLAERYLPQAKRTDWWQQHWWAIWFLLFSTLTLLWPALLLAPLLPQPWRATLFMPLFYSWSLVTERFLVKQDQIGRWLSHQQLQLWRDEGFWPLPGEPPESKTQEILQHVWPESCLLDNEPFQPSDTVVFLPCGHFAHLAAFLTWSRDNRRCHYCNQSFERLGLEIKQSWPGLQKFLAEVVTAANID
jgi:hypothetical protein